MGAATTFEDIKQASTKPKLLITGFVLQCFFMPVLAYVLALIFQLSNPVAIGAVITGACPGSTLSNLFTYWAKGDLALSITLSFLSSIAAFVFLPFWTWLLVKVALKAEAQVSWGDMIISLLIVIVPIIIGLLIRKYNTKTKLCGKFIWNWIELSASILGMIVLVGLVAVAVIAHGNIFLDMYWNVWVAAAVLQPVGSLFGFYTVKLLGGSAKHQRTICLEVGINSFSLAIATITFSFSEDDVLHYAMQFPVGYGLLFLVYSPLITAFFRFYLARKDPLGEEEASKTTVNDYDEEGTLQRSLLYDTDSQ